ncbi:MAG: hypothetical protein VKK59_07600 [Vampirovibrionales bacterium]|nr:hypothetical protein [Vampirovibrionales bacterium]
MLRRIITLVLNITLVMMFLIGGSLRVEWAPETSNQALNHKAIPNPVPFQVQVALRFQWPKNAPKLAKTNDAAFINTIGWLITQGLWQRWSQLIYIGPYQAAP